MIHSSTIYPSAVFPPALRRLYTSHRTLKGQHRHCPAALLEMSRSTSSLRITTMLPILCLLFLLSDIASAKPHRYTRSHPDGSPGSFHIPIQKRSIVVPSLTPSQRGARLLSGLNMAGMKYGITPRRQSAGVAKREPKGFVQMGDTIEDL